MAGRVSLLLVFFSSVVHAQTATDLVKKEGMSELQPAVRLTGSGFMVQHRIPVEGGYCYAAALTWATPATTMLGIGFERRPDGQPVNDSFAVVNGRFAPPGGVKRFCADRSGNVLLTLTMLTPAGTVDMNPRFDHQLVVGRVREAKNDAAARRGGEQVRANQARAQTDANIAAAEERDRQNQAQRCRQCDSDYRLCQVEDAQRRRHPPPGVSFNVSCEEQLRQCGFPTKSEALSRRSEWRCTPPR